MYSSSFAIVTLGFFLGASGAEGKGRGRVSAGKIERWMDGWIRGGRKTNRRRMSERAKIPNSPPTHWDK